MWQASLKYLTDMGSKEECEQVVDENGQRMAAYASNKSNVTDLRGIARSGYCLPIQCTQEQLNFVTDYMNGFVNWGIDMLPTLGINIDILIFRTGLT